MPYLTLKYLLQGYRSYCLASFLQLQWAWEGRPSAESSGGLLHPAGARHYPAVGTCLHHKHNTSVPHHTSMITSTPKNIAITLSSNLHDHTTTLSMYCESIYNKVYTINKPLNAPLKYCLTPLSISVFTVCSEIPVQYWSLKGCTAILHMKYKWSFKYWAN